jgi:transposase
MGKIYTEDELKKLNKSVLINLFITTQESMQAQLDQLNQNMERLIEQIAVANNQRYGRKTEKLETIDGQLDLSTVFNEAEGLMDTTWFPEPSIDDIVKPTKPKKSKGKREADLKDLPVEIIEHTIPEKMLKETFGDSWKELPVETYKRVKYIPASCTVEEHRVHLYAGKDQEGNDKIIRAKRPVDLLRNSIATPSLVSAIMNGKYVNALPLYRMEQEFERNDVNIKRQVMANWMIQCSERYLSVLYDRLHQALLGLDVVQSDETPVLVAKDGRATGTKSYMWVHRSGKSYKDIIILYDFQKTRSGDHAEAFLSGFTGTCVSDGFSAYEKLDKKLKHIQFAGCWAHARRRFVDALKALKDKSEAKGTIANEALRQIAAIYKLNNELEDKPPDEQLKMRQLIVKPLVEAFFVWAKEQQSSLLPKGKTAEGLNYCINQEKSLKVFLDTPSVPMDNNATEGALRGFVIGRNNWKMIDTIDGAKASAMIYSITETAKANKLNPYKYLNHLLSVIPKHMDDKNLGFLEDLLPWSENLPEECHNLKARQQVAE